MVVSTFLIMELVLYVSPGVRVPIGARHPRDDVIDQVGSCFGHAPGAARGAKSAPLTGKRYQLLMGAVTAAQAQKAVGQDAAFEKGIKLVFDKLR